MGRPTKYRKEYCDQIVEFFDVDDTEIIGDEERAARLPTFAGFARKLLVPRTRLHEWAKKHPEFQDAMNICKTIQEDIMVNNGIRGFFSSGFAQLAMKNMNTWRDKQDVQEKSESISIQISPDDVSL